MKELVNTETFKNGFLKAGKKVCEKRKQRRERGSTWWRYEEVQEAIREKRAHLERCAKSNQKREKSSSSSSSSSFGFSLLRVATAR